jgi:hypothetical protein
MSAETTKEIIGKAFVDPEYRELLLSKPKEALEGYELTEEEREDLESLTPDIFDLELSELEDRISKGTCIN